MAFIDYGAIAWKDGKLISKEFFDSMKDMVGWKDSADLALDEDTASKTLHGNYFTYVGDEDFTACFYKHTMTICYKDMLTGEYKVEKEWFNWAKYYGWKRYKNFYFVKEGIFEDMVEITVKPRFRFGHNYLVFTMRYKDHTYKVAFGYGVDLAYYKKYHIIDYYGTPWHIAKNKLHDIKWKVYYNGWVLTVKPNIKYYWDKIFHRSKED